MKPRPIAERFMEKVSVDTRTGCWRWQGYVMPIGYGRFCVLGKQAYAHRVAYELFIGPIPEGMEIDHVKERGCEYRDCVNPEHLEPVSRYENNRRSDSITARKGRQERCARGHEFSIEHCSGVRRCVVCHNAARRRRRARKRARDVGH